MLWKCFNRINMKRILFGSFFPLEYTTQYEVGEDQVWSHFVAYWSSLTIKAPQHKISIG